jgi:hypothetical protein
VEDVPAAHCFEIEDLCAVTVVGSGMLEVELSFEVKFKSPTMMKFMIESNSNREMNNWLKKYSVFLKEKGEADVVDKSDVTTTPTATNSSQIHEQTCKPSIQVRAIST